jgi:nucleotide-binding universal stress UspA family protein
MNKILVTTDFSTASKAGIRFALQLAKQTKGTLIVFHAMGLPKPTRWGDNKYNAYAEAELKKAHIRLMRFIDSIGLQSGFATKAVQGVVTEGWQVDRSVIDYATHIKANFICMSTRGAGLLKKMVGTNASTILTTSPIPVIVVPKTYQVSPISHILYSSDFNTLGSEMKKVVDFAKPLKAKVSVYHYDFLLPLDEAKIKLEKIAAKHSARNVKFYFKKLHIENSLAHHLQNDIRKSKPSLVALFTKQNRGWYDRLFLSSKSAEISFNTKTPLLVFRKREH